jgi:hypothetical protein
MSLALQQTYGLLSPPKEIPVKTLIALVCILTTSSAMALSPRSSWAQIFSSGATLSFEEDLGDIKLNNACVTETEIRTIKPVTVCVSEVEQQEVFDQLAVTTYVCEKWGPQSYAFPRTSKKLFCVEDGSFPNAAAGKGCLEYGEIETTIKDTIQVSVRDPGDVWPVFKKSFTFPACK